MRILVTTYPEKTHFLAMAPLAWALRTAGHEVLCAVQPGFVDTVTTAGLTAVPVGRDRDPQRMIELAPEWRESGRLGLPPPYDVATREPGDVDWEYLRTEFGTQVSRWHQMENFPMIGDLVALARRWKPDLVIWEPTTFAGSIAAKACGAAHARLLFSLDIFGVTRELYLRLKAQQPPEDRADPLADWLGAYARRYGSDFSEDMITGHFTIDQFPPSLRMPADLHYTSLRYTPYGGPSTIPDWLHHPPERPRVALTLGMVATERFDGYAFDLGGALAALSELDIEIVATIDELTRRRLGPLPGNIRAVPYVPLNALIPTCTAAIHHAGFGTLSTVALHGLPHLVLPGDIDGPELARRLAAQGSSRVVEAASASGEVIRENLSRLLTEPRFRERARALRAEFLDLPTPNELVPQLEELVTKYRTGRHGEPR
ncbi:activator-dependent family glycosyltransferase [Prauserella cavernicola]|uniref:Activator-dependent family glycosyltransferase n=1 Tax=Prauserella cavernicola TaxID=2800127 RepID=A0A934QYZ2_9PSEU|nr:activator-dependent family glycosyltransferase [Prauserella cavernicola]MBK1787853.1 activator-dependent family glycosyltransferase [Prauserella cavernicola]